MSSDHTLTRRTALKTGVCGVVGMAAASFRSEAQAGCGSCAKTKEGTLLTSKRFYTDGAFDAKKALDAYYDMMNRFGYPIPDVLRTDQFWTCDFLQEDFMKLGMGGIFWINAQGTYGKSGTAQYKGTFKDALYGYLGHDIFLLPGQVLPEHSHVGGPEDRGPKMESWQVRYGTVDFFGQHKGAGDEMLISDMPESDRPWGYGEKWFKSKYVARRTAKSGQLYTLEDPESWHFQRAGAEGAIVTEYATYHNDVRFSKPGMAFDSTKPKS